MKGRSNLHTAEQRPGSGESPDGAAVNGGPEQDMAK